MSEKIHIVTHLNPDYDAYASLLFMYALLKKNFPNKGISMSVETEKPNTLLVFLPYFKSIEYDSLPNILERTPVDLVIIVDTSSIKRTTSSVERVYILRSKTKWAVFDHHKIENTDFDLLVNNNRSAAVEEIYNYALQQSLSLPEKWEEYYLTGFIGDTYRFYYSHPTYRDSFETIATILDHGYTIREFSDKLYGYTQNDLTVIKPLLNHLSINSGYAFSYMTWKEFRQIIENKIPPHEYKKARR